MKNILKKQIPILFILLCFFCFLFICILFSFFSSLFKSNLEKTKIKEGFEWSQYEKDQFILAQHINNPKIIYDLEQLQKYASQEEVDIFLQTGFWPWSEEVQNLYMDALEKNPYVRTYKTDGLNRARKIYNQYAILYILKNQEQLEKEYREKNKMIELTQEDNEENGYGDYSYGTTIIT